MAGNPEPIGPDYGESVELHTMLFSDVHVEVNIDGEGNAWVNLNQNGDTFASFTAENFADVAEFVRKHATGEI